MSFHLFPSKTIYMNLAPMLFPNATNRWRCSDYSSACARWL